MSSRNPQPGQSLPPSRNTANGASLHPRIDDRPAAPRSSVLNSWKEIAAYLGRGVRTVQRWERHLNLPVHRAEGKYHSAVLAFPEELDVWLHRMPAGRNPAGSELAPVLLDLACDLLCQAERLVNLNGRHRPAAGNSLSAIRQIVRELTSFTDKFRSSPPA